MNALNKLNKLFTMALCLLTAGQANSLTDAQEPSRQSTPAPKPIAAPAAPKTPPGPSAAEIQAKAEAARARQALRDKEEESKAKDAEIALLKREAQAKPPAASSVVVVAPTPPPPADTPFKATEAFPGGPVMVSLPAGTFMMGSMEYDNEKDARGGPHSVTIAKKFAMGQTEVTVAQYMACVNDAQSCDAPAYALGTANFPVVGVRWVQASQYAAWVTRKAGFPKDSTKRFRLPTEAEWEYAASEGGKTKWSGTNTESELSEYANIFYKLDEVKQRKPNAFKLYDMSGNVMEWVEDVYQNNYDHVPVDGSPYYGQGGSGTGRVLRGGFWVNNPRDLRSATRYDGTHINSGNYIGFRLARTEF